MIDLEQPNYLKELMSIAEGIDTETLRIARGDRAVLSNQPITLNEEVSEIAIIDGDATEKASGRLIVPMVTRTLYVSGLPGANVEMILFRQPDTGGHHHGGQTTNPGAVGTLSSSRFTLGGGYPQNHPVQWTFPEVSGSVGVLVRFSNGDLAGGIADIYYVQGLVSLSENQTLRLKAPTRDHLSPYWVTPQMRVALQGVADQFFIDTGMVTTITDGSLQYGGLFDWKGTWAPPHREHRDGKVVDARIWPHTDAQKLLFERLCDQRGLHAERHVDPPHWHIRFR